MAIGNGPGPKPKGGAPVDTVALKQNIVNTVRKFTGGPNVPGTANTMAGLEAMDRTLAKARAGKIKATAGPAPAAKPPQIPHPGDNDPLPAMHTSQDH